MASYGGLNQRYFGASATDLVITAQSYGRSIKVINDVSTLNAYLSEGYPVIFISKCWDWTCYCRS